MRIGIAVLISLWCAGCALSEKPAAVAPQQAAALEKPAPVADAAPPDSNAATERSQRRKLAASSTWRAPGCHQDSRPTGRPPILRPPRTNRRRTRRGEPEAVRGKASLLLADPGPCMPPTLRRLPKRVMPYIDPPRWGHVAEWLRNGLQNRVHQFNSGRGLHLNH